MAILLLYLKSLDPQTKTLGWATSLEPGYKPRNVSLNIMNP